MNIFEFFKDYGTTLSICATVILYYHNQTKTKHNQRKLLLTNLINHNSYYNGDTQHSPSTSIKIMEILNKVKEIFEFNHNLSSTFKQFIDSHDPKLDCQMPEKYRRLLLLELELSKQCQYWFQSNNFKTTYQIEQMPSYIPLQYLWSDLEEFNLTREMNKYYSRINDFRDKQNNKKEGNS